MTIIPLRAFAENCIWPLRNVRQALAVDPGDAQPARSALQQVGLQQAVILVTHQHFDLT